MYCYVIVVLVEYKVGGFVMGSSDKKECFFQNKRKGFTLIEIIAVVVIIAILAALIIPAIARYVKSGKNRYNKELESQLVLVGKDYYASNPRELPENGKIKQVWLPFLKTNNYTSEEFKDADGGKCAKSYVRVKKENDNYEYIACLVCDNYKTIDPKYCVLDDSFIDNEGNNKCPNVVDPTCEVKFIDYDGKWTNQDVSFTVTASASTSNDDPVCLDNKVTYIRFGNSNIGDLDFSGKTSVTSKISNSVSGRLEVTAEDLLGKSGVCKVPDVDVKIDKNAPVCKWEGPYSDVNGALLGGACLPGGSSVYYRLNCTDSESGLATKIVAENIQKNSFFSSVKLVDTKSINDGESYLFEAVMGTSSSGYGKLILPAGIVKDNAGNANESAFSDGACVLNNTGGGEIVFPPSDNTPPTCTISMKKADGTAYYEGDWSNQNVTVTANCSDSSGVADISYSPSQTISKDGVTNVTVTATDYEGNRGFYYTSVQIDKTKPKCTLTMTQSDGKSYSSGSWTNKNVKVEIGCSDTGGSGLKDGYFTSNEATSKYRKYHTVDIEGTSKIASYAVDNAGNEYTSSKTVKLDKTPPALDSLPCYNGRNEKNYMVFKYPWTDSGSGLGTIKSKHCYSTGVASSMDYSCAYTGGIDGRSWDSRAGQFSVGNRVDSVYMEYKALPSSSKSELHVSSKWYVCDVVGNCANYGAPYVDHLNYSSGKYKSGNRSTCSGVVELDTYTRKVCQRKKTGGETTYSWKYSRSGSSSGKVSSGSGTWCKNNGYSASYAGCAGNPCNSSTVGKTCRTSSGGNGSKVTCTINVCTKTTTSATYSDWTCVESSGQKQCTESKSDIETVTCTKE